MGGIYKVTSHGSIDAALQQAPQMGPYAGTMITTELIQKYLDENKQLILAILDNQNLGKLHECAAYQSKLQQNLMYLAAIADAQPQAPIPATQMQMAPTMQGMPGSMLQTNPQYMQQPQMLDQQQNYNNQMQALQAHRQQQLQLQQQQQRLVAAAGIHPEIDLGGNNSTSSMPGMGGFPDYAASHGGNTNPAAASNGDARNGSGDLRAAVSGDGSKAGSQAAAAPGDGNLTVNGDDAGSTFLKASEDE